MAVVDVQVRSRQPYGVAAGWGDAPRYERLDLLVDVAIDPESAANSFVADVELAPRGRDGLVSFEVDACLLQPVDPSDANGSLLTSVVNRGRMDLVPFSFPPSAMAFTVTDRVEPGDGFLLRRGWTVLFCGWQWDVVRRPGRLGVAVPAALGAQGRITVQFQPNHDRSAEYLGHWPWHPRPGHPDITHVAYPTADLDDTTAVLTERDWPGGQRRTVPRERWRFARLEHGTLRPDACWVWSADGFRAGVVYELVYRTASCPVAGLGLVAVRDVPSFLRHGSAAERNPCAGRISRTVAWGVSQTGRFLREFLAGAANVDEQGRTVHDGLYIQVAGARRGEFNQRGAQPSVQYVRGPAQDPPYRHEPGLLDHQRASGGVPRIVEINTANEYWRSDAALIHVDPEAGVDVEPPAEVRLYALAGTQHVPGMAALSREPILLPEASAANWINQVNYTATLRALLVALEQWLADGTEPPPSAVPRLDDGSAVDRSEVIVELPGLVLPDPAKLPTIHHRVLVSAVDADGNEIAGVRPPDVAVPLATHLGWNVRAPATGGAGQLMDMLGSSLPFPASDDVRHADDPRPSVAARYRSRDDFLSRVRAAVDELVARRLLLEEDVARVVATSGRLYDLAMRASAVAAAGG